MSRQPPLLLSIVELGAYPNFSPLFERLGYRHETVRSGRRANSALKQLKPAVLIAEFNYEPNFRDRTSALESVLALIHQLPDTQVIVFYEQADEPLLDKLYQRFPLFERMAYPIEERALEETLRSLAG
jgi:hypothetical protein